MSVNKQELQIELNTIVEKLAVDANQDPIKFKKDVFGAADKIKKGQNIESVLTSTWRKVDENGLICWGLIGVFAALLYSLISEEDNNMVNILINSISNIPEILIKLTFKIYQNIGVQKKIADIIDYKAKQKSLPSRIGLKIATFVMRRVNLDNAVGRKAVTMGLNYFIPNGPLKNIKIGAVIYMPAIMFLVSISAILWVVYKRVSNNKMMTKLIQIIYDKNKHLIDTIKNSVNPSNQTGGGEAEFDEILKVFDKDILTH